MSQSSRTIHDYRRINVGQTLLQVSPAGTAITLGNSHSGDLITLTATSGSAIRLPAPSAGLSFPFVVAATSAGHVITAPAGTLFGAVTVAVPTAGSTINVSATGGSTTLSTTTGSVVGDRIQIVSDGTKYFVSGSIARFNGVTF